MNPVHSSTFLCMHYPLRLAFFCIWSLEYPLKPYWSLTSSRKHFLALLAVVTTPSPVSLPYLFKPLQIFTLCLKKTLLFSVSLVYRKAMISLKPRSAGSHLSPRLYRSARHCSGLFIFAYHLA